MAGPKQQHFQHVRELDGDVVIVDDGRDVAHRLTGEAASIWRACDGCSDVAEIATTSGVSETVARGVLTQLRAVGLLEEEPGPGLATRRAMLRRSVLTGVGVAGLPLISSIVLPTAAQAFTSQPTMGPREGPPPVATGATGPAVTPSATVPGKPTVKSTGAVKGVHKSSPHHAILGAGRSSSPTGSGVAGVSGGGATGRRVASGTLPFTGSRLVQSAAVGTVMIAVGVTTRRAVLRHEPPAT